MSEIHMAREQHQGELIAEVAARDLRKLLDITKMLMAEMERLACLGNGNTFGNSVGNTIAIAALHRANEMSK